MNMKQVCTEWLIGSLIGVVIGLVILAGCCPGPELSPVHGGTVTTDHPARVPLLKPGCGRCHDGP